MIRHILILLSVGLLILSCSEVTNPESNQYDVKTGIMSFKMDMKSAPADVISLKGMLYRAQYDTIYFDFEVEGDSATALVKDLATGGWTLEVNALNDNNIIIYNGSTYVYIFPGVTTPVNLHLNPTTGSLSILVTWGGYSDNKLLAFYPFDGNANDESGNGIDGIVYGAELDSDRFGRAANAYYFDGLDDFIDLGNYFNFDFDSSFSLCSWIKTDQASGLQTIFSKAENTRNSNDLYVLTIHYQYARACVRDTVEQDINAMGSLFLSDNRWHFVAMTYDGLNQPGSIKLYVDGSFDTMGIKRGEPITMLNSDHASIGCEAVGYRSRNYFKGSIDDVRVYKGVLSPSDIENLYYSE